MTAARISAKRTNTTPNYKETNLFPATMNLESVQQKATEVAKEDFDKYKALAKDAVHSGAFLYPLKGILYFVTHRALWKPLLSRLLPTLSLSAAVVAFMFVFTYVPQAFALSFVNGPCM